MSLDASFDGANLQYFTKFHECSFLEFEALRNRRIASKTKNFTWNVLCMKLYI